MPRVPALPSGRPRSCRSVDTAPPRERPRARDRRPRCDRRRGPPAPPAAKGASQGQLLLAGGALGALGAGATRALGGLTRLLALANQLRLGLDLLLHLQSR